MLKLTQPLIAQILNSKLGKVLMINTTKVNLVLYRDCKKISSDVCLIKAEKVTVLEYASCALDIEWLDGYLAIIKV